MTIDPMFFDKKFSVSRYMLRFVVSASTDEIRHQQLHKIKQYRAIADTEIEGVIDENFANFNTSLARFASISTQLQDTRNKVQEVSKRTADGRNILSSKTKNLRELLLQKYEAKNVIEIIDDIQHIEAAPSKIHTMLDERNFLGAVDMFTHSLNLVFSERLVAFHAITGIRNALMECKQLIEDRIVQELQQVIYLKDAFTNFAKANQYSLASIERELSNQSFLDNEFDKHMLDAKQQDANRCQFASDYNFSGGQGANPLEETVRAAKKLHREMEVIGTLKSSIESELNEVVVQISLICRGIFNASSYTSFDNSFTEKTFGTHDHSATFQTFLRLLFHVVRRIAQRHFLVSVYFESDGENWNYGMQEVITKISGLIERVLGEYLDESASADSSISTKSSSISSDGGDMFKLSRNKPISEAAAKLLHLPHEADLVKKEGVDGAMTRVCEPSVFHLPVVYEDLELIAKDLHQYFHTANPLSSTGIGSFLRLFITQQWIPKVKNKAQQFLDMKYRTFTTLRRLPVPSDTSYQPPSIDSLLFIVEHICDMMSKMPEHALDLVGVLDCTVLKWLEECTTIARDIRESTLNHRLIVQNVSYAELISVFHEYVEWQQQHKADPSRSIRESTVRPATLSARILRPDLDKEAQRLAVLAENVVVPLPPQASVLPQRETELEKELCLPASWANGTKGLLMDNARIGMLAYVNSACSLVVQHLEKVRSSGTASSSEPHKYGHASRIALPSSTLQQTISKCQVLADECLFFLRREVRLHAFYYLTQLIPQKFDAAEGKPTMAHDCVLSLNINLSAIENALRPYLSSNKMALVFDGIAALLSNILINNLQQMNGRTFTKGGVQQMLLNIGAIHQGMTGTLYSYPSVGRAGHHFDHAKRYYQLLNLSETQLEVFLLENRKAYSHEAFKALWRVETPHRQLAKGSVNKLDSILR